MHSNELVTQSRKWLVESVFPLWIKRGIDSKNGAFIENLTQEGIPSETSRRAMVQSRQIYSFTEAAKMGVLSTDVVKPIIERAIKSFIENYKLPNGAFAFSVNVQGKIDAYQTELYSQAFVLFGLARAYGLIKNDIIRSHALDLLKYLNTERKHKNSGYTEIKNEKVLFQSNPHMHLFEAAIEWIKVDNDSCWIQLADDLFKLCTEKFIDPQTQLLGEHFDENWILNRENSKFVFEPGHQFEWAWLMLEYEKCTGADVGKYPKQLFINAEKNGIFQNSNFAVDEVWSDFNVKKSSSRFWPQCERVKAAVSLGLKSSTKEREIYIKAADQGMLALFEYLSVPLPGLWRDTRQASGEFDSNPAKASSLYHIINAMSEYVSKRPLL